MGISVREQVFIRILTGILAKISAQKVLHDGFVTEYDHVDDRCPLVAVVWWSSHGQADQEREVCRACFCDCNELLGIESYYFNVCIHYNEVLGTAICILL
jgi:hypothetical protein